MTIRCKACGLNQFMTTSGNCRKCRKPLVQVEPVIKAPEPLPVIERVEPDERPITYGDVFRTCRLAMGWSQTDMGKRLKRPRTWLSKIEQNKVIPTYQSIHVFAAALGVSPNFIVSMLDEVYGQRFYPSVPVTRTVASHQSQGPRTISSEEKLT